MDALTRCPAVPRTQTRKCGDCGPLRGLANARCPSKGKEPRREQLASCKPRRGQGTAPPRPLSDLCDAVVSLHVGRAMRTREPHGAAVLSCCTFTDAPAPTGAGRQRTAAEEEAQLAQCGCHDPVSTQAGPANPGPTSLWESESGSQRTTGAGAPSTPVF